MGWFGPRGDCGCCEACEIASDDFESGDALTVAWEGDTGSFSKGSGVVTSTTADKLLIHQTAHSDDNHIASWTITLPTNGDKIGVVIGFVDSDKYLVAELERDTNLTLRLFARTGGTDTQIATRTIFLSDGAFILKAGHKDRTFCADVVKDAALVGGVTVQTSLTGLGNQSGCRTGDTVTGTITLDDFVFSDHGDSDNNCPECRFCDHCADNDAPEVLQVIVSNAANNFCSDCSTRNGTYILPTLLRTASSCQWRVATGSTGCLGATHLWVIINSSSLRVGFGNSFGPDTEDTGTADSPPDDDCDGWSSYLIEQDTPIPGFGECLSMEFSITAL